MLFFFVTLMPVSNLIRPIGSIMAERFLYFPLIGFCLAAAYGLAALAGKIADATASTSRERILAGLALPVLLLAGFGFRTYARNMDWDSEFSLWESAAAASPNSFKVHKGLANAHWNRSRNEAGLDDRR